MVIGFAAEIASDGKPFVLESGRQHELPFSFVLPDAIPSSFEGKFGHIRYIIRATLIRPGKWNYQCRIGFNVSSFVDLNAIPGAKVLNDIQHL